jgi:predicted small integral membrane protein
MEKNNIEELILKYNEGLADPSEIKMIESLIERGSIDLTRLNSLHQLDEQMDSMIDPVPSMRLDDQFRTWLSSEERKAQRRVFEFAWPNWSFLAPRLAVACVLILAGFAVGTFVQRPGGNAEVSALTKEVSTLKEMMMLSLLEKESATDRLKAVSLTSEMNNVSQKVTQALFQTLNEDENINVRLAALEALKGYVKDSQVREGLIRSISKQDSPVIQVELAQLMAAIQAKKSVKALQKIVESDKTPSDIKKQIKESIQILI